MIEKEFTISNLLGLHIRASDKLVTCASSFASEVIIHFNNQTIDAKRILKVMSLGAKQGDKIKLCVKGPDCNLAMEVITKLIESGFEENECKAD